jgi:hypothetical protein
MYKGLEDVKRVIEKSKPEAVIGQFWVSYQEGLQHDVWKKQMQGEYEVLWPTTEEVLVTETDEDGKEIPVMVTDEEGNETQATKQVDIDYSENEAYVTFEEWLQERETLTGTRTVVDDEGDEVEEDYEYEGGLLRQFVFDDSDLPLVSELPEYKVMVRCKRDDVIAKLKVTTASGKQFDADEKSRQRMADAILASETTGQKDTLWKLATNDIVTVGYGELREAHALALQAFGQVILGD